MGWWLDRLLLVLSVGVMVGVVLGAVRAVRGQGRAAPRNPPWRTWRRGDLVFPALLLFFATTEDRNATQRWSCVFFAGAAALEFTLDLARWWGRGRHLERSASRAVPPGAGPDPVGAWVCMPDLGDRVGEGVVTSWLKQEGDEVRAGQPLLEVSTDKVDTEIPAPADGVLARIAVPTGHTVTVGTRLAVISASTSMTSAATEPNGTA